MSREAGRRERVKGRVGERDKGRVICGAGEWERG